jgi:hypothetical protein
VVVPSPHLTAASVECLQTEAHFRLRYFYLAFHQDSTPSILFVDQLGRAATFACDIPPTGRLEKLEASGMREAAGRRPGGHRRSVVIGSASRRSTTRNRGELDFTRRLGRIDLG